MSDMYVLAFTDAINADNNFTVPIADLMNRPNQYGFVGCKKVTTQVELTEAMTELNSACTQAIAERGLRRTGRVVASFSFLTTDTTPTTVTRNLAVAKALLPPK
jgi:hypothetical protein